MDVLGMSVNGGCSASSIYSQTFKELDPSVQYINMYMRMLTLTSTSLPFDSLLSLSCYLISSHD